MAIFESQLRNFVFPGSYKGRRDLVDPVVYQIQIDAEIVERTGWDYYTLRSQPSDWLMELVIYWNTKSAYDSDKLERERSR